jgi:drug/metabolite transporter (DMT)-like permease
VAHFCVTKALSLAPTGVVMTMDFARLPIIALVGAALYAEDLQWAILAGGLLIFAANSLSIRAEARRHPPRVHGR